MTEKSIWEWICTFLVLFLLVLYPAQVLLSIDEVRYLSQLVQSLDSSFADPSICHNDPLPWVPVDYPLGNVLRLWIGSMCQLRLVFLPGILALAGGVYLTGLTAKRLSNSYLPALLILLSPLLWFFSHSVMSELPSFLLIAMTTYFVVDDKDRLWIIGCLGGMSFWFREANVILAGALLIVSSRVEPRRLLILGLGFMCGLIPRIVASHIMYGQLLYLKPNPGWSFASGGENLLSMLAIAKVAYIYTYWLTLIIIL